MKKFILPALAAGLLAFTSCKKEEKTTVDAAVVEVPEANGTTTTTTSTQTTTVEGMPTFSSPEVTQFATDYTVFTRQMADAYKKQDAAAMQKLAATQQEWSAKTTAIASKFTAEDQVKWREYSEKITAEMQAAMMNK